VISDSFAHGTKTTYVRIVHLNGEEGVVARDNRVLNPAVVGSRVETLVLRLGGPTDLEGGLRIGTTDLKGGLRMECEAALVQGVLSAPAGEGDVESWTGVSSDKTRHSSKADGGVEEV